MPVLMALGLSMCLVSSANAQADGGDSWIENVSTDGYLVVMADRSIWLVEGYYVDDTSAWLPADNVVYASTSDRCMNAEDARSMVLVNVDEHDLACALRVH